MRNIDFSSWQAGLSTLIGLLVALLSDLIYTWIDPRIDFERRDV